MPPRRLPRPACLHAVAARTPAVLRRFLRGTRAAVGIAAALLTVGTVAGAALIVDHVWLYDQRDVLKAAGDAASLAASDHLIRNPGASDADLEVIAERYVLINLAHLPSKQLDEAKRTLTIDLKRVHGTVNVIAQADLGGTLLSRHLLGGYEGPDSIKVEAGVVTDAYPAEVILAIDTSNSMSTNLKGVGTDTSSLPSDRTCSASSIYQECSRMEIVKRAALELVGILEPNAPNRVAVGVVPWHIQVRLDTEPGGTADTWASKGWADYPTHRRYEVPYLNCERGNSSTCTNLPAGVEEALPASAPQEWKGCLNEDRVDAGGTAALPPLDELFDPPSRNAPFAQGYFTSGFGTAHQCHDPRSADFPADLTFQLCDMVPPGLSSAPGGHRINGRLSPQYACRPGTETILPLSTAPAKIRETIEALAPVGGLTYSALGVLWGQRLLTPSWKNAWGGSGAHPVGPGDPDADKVRKAIVLLTDGEDTYCGLGNHSCEDSPLGMARADACEAAKKAGTEIFVVAAMKPSHISTSFEDALTACSSEGDAEYPAGTRRAGGKYIFPNNATPERLEAAFADIGRQLRTLRRIQ